MQVDGNRECSVVVNARVNSTRLSAKLVRPFSGTTLLDIALKKLSELDSPHVYLAASLNEEQIISIYENYKTSVRLLPRSQKSVEQGKKHQSCTFKHFLQLPTPYVLSVNPCAPFLSISTILDALELFKSDNRIRTMTGVLEEYNLFFDNEKQMLNASSFDVSTQGNKRMFSMSHSFHIFDINFFAENGFFWDYSVNNPFLYIIDKKEITDIDYLEDFQYCEWLYEKTINSYSK